MPINADAQITPIRRPDFFARINSWILVTNSLPGEHSLYFYSDGILRFQIIPLGGDRVIQGETIPNSPNQLISINSHSLNIMNFFYPAITACNIIEVTIADLTTFATHTNLFDIEWRFIKTA